MIQQCLSEIYPTQRKPAGAEFRIALQGPESEELRQRSRSDAHLILPAFIRQGGKMCLAEGEIIHETV